MHPGSRSAVKWSYMHDTGAARVHEAIFPVVHMLLYLLPLLLYTFLILPPSQFVIPTMDTQINHGNVCAQRITAKIVLS
jgi:hypothetical protein